MSFGTTCGRAKAAGISSKTEVNQVIGIKNIISRKYDRVDLEWAKGTLCHVVQRN